MAKFIVPLHKGGQYSPAAQEKSIEDNNEVIPCCFITGLRKLFCEISD